MTVRRYLRRFAIVVFSVTSVGILPNIAGAQDAEPAVAVEMELNKLETYKDGCRAYIVVTNKNDRAYTSFKLDLVLFQTDGVIGKRFALDLAPLRAEKKNVKLFEIDGTQCDTIGSFLINDVMECKTAAGDVDGCMTGLDTSSRNKVELSK